MLAAIDDHQKFRLIHLLCIDPISQFQQMACCFIEHISASQYCECFIPNFVNSLFIKYAHMVDDEEIRQGRLPELFIRLIAVAVAHAFGRDQNELFYF